MIRRSDDATSVTKLSPRFVEAVQSSRPASGTTHSFYKYPARFSPDFARTAIMEFSNPGDVVLDPFMGSGTTLVEALLLGRSTVGSDISSLAAFLAKVKTTVLDDGELVQLRRWVDRILPSLNLRSPAPATSLPEGYDRHLPWPIRKTIQLFLEGVARVREPKHRNFLRCTLLRAAQTAVDCTTHVPSASEFRKLIVEAFELNCTGLREFRDGVARSPGVAEATIVHASASTLAQVWPASWERRADLVVTSPPYPLVHVLYHRWQVRGRRETPAPFWIAGTKDGRGEAYYTMGGRTANAESTYFRQITDAFSQVYHVTAPRAAVVQLIAFSDIERHLPRYLSAMSAAGFEEVDYRLSSEADQARLWREVPLRRWYASYQGRTDGSREVLLIHRRSS